MPKMKTVPSACPKQVARLKDRTDSDTDGRSKTTFHRLFGRAKNFTVSHYVLFCNIPGRLR